MEITKNILALKRKYFYFLLLLLFGNIFFGSCIGSGSPDDFPCNLHKSFPTSKQRVCNSDQSRNIGESEHNKKVERLCVLLSSDCINKCLTDSNPDSCVNSNCKTFLICTSGIYFPPWAFQ